MDLFGLGALGLVVLEWVFIGWLSAVSWPPEAAVFWAPRWALRLLVGAILVGFAQLLLAALGVGFGTIPMVLGVAALLGGAMRLPRVRRPAQTAARRTPPAAIRVVVGGGDSAPPQEKLAATWNSEAPSYRRDRHPSAMAPRELFGWLLLAALLLAATVRSIVVPEAGWDAYSHWGLRAQAYALAGNVISANSEHEYYPPLVPLLEAWLYLHRGHVAIDLGKTIWAVIGGAFGVCLSWHLSLSLPTRWAAPYCAAAILAGATALLEGFWTGQADLALTACLTLATLAVFQWHRQRANAWLAQATLFAAAAALSKLEGAPRLAVVAVAVLLEAGLRRRIANLYPAALLAAAAGLMVVLWTGTAARYGIDPNSEHLGQFQPLAIGAVALGLVAVFGGLRTGGALVVAVLAWVVGGRRVLEAPLRLLGLVVLGQFVATLLAFLLSDPSPEAEVRTSATRLFGQWLPLALSAGALAVDREPGGDGSYNRRGR